MAKYQVAVRISEINSEIPEAKKRLAHLINRQREIQAYDAPNKEFKRKLLAKYKLDIKKCTDTINNLNMELWGLQELSLQQK